MRVKLFLIALLIVAAVLFVVCGEKGVSEPELARGTLVRVTTEGGVHPDWSNDGAKILFRYSVGDDYTIYSISPDGGQPTAILNLTARNIRYPRWHPDTSTQIIAFLLRVNETDWAICKYDIGAAKLDTLYYTNREFTGLDFTRDGNYLAFLREPSSTSGIWLIPVDGGDPVQLVKPTPWYLVTDISCDQDADTISYLEFEKAKSAWNLFSISGCNSNLARPVAISKSEIDYLFWSNTAHFHHF